MMLALFAFLVLLYTASQHRDTYAGMQYCFIDLRLLVC